MQQTRLLGNAMAGILHNHWQCTPTLSSCTMHSVSDCERLQSGAGARHPEPVQQFLSTTRHIRPLLTLLRVDLMILVCFSGSHILQKFIVYLFLTLKYVDADAANTDAADCITDWSC